MTVKLAYNGSVLAQNAVIYSQCLQYQKDVPISLRPHSGSFFEKICQNFCQNLASDIFETPFENAEMASTQIG